MDLGDEITMYAVIGSLLYGWTKWHQITIIPVIRAHYLRWLDPKLQPDQMFSIWLTNLTWLDKLQPLLMYLV